MTKADPKKKKARKKKGDPGGLWKNRIVGSDVVDPNKLIENPLNWRVHNEFQKRSLGGALDEVGWVQPIVVNQNTMVIIDGHLRVSLAIERGETQIPIILVDLDEQEQKKVLATLDPLAALAGTDVPAYSELIEGVETDDLWLREMMQRIGDDSEPEKEEKEEPGLDESVPELEMKPFEHYDYIVLMFKNELDFAGACAKLGVDKVAVTIPQGKKKVGLGRVVDGAKAVATLCK